MNLSPESQKLLIEWIRALEQLPPATKRKDYPKFLIDNKETTLCACDKQVAVVALSVKDSGVIKYLDNVCVGCEDRAKGLATIICATCRLVVMRLAPDKDKYGFKFEAGEVYHVERCRACEKELENSPIIEVLLFHKERGIS